MQFKLRDILALLLVIAVATVWLLEIENEVSPKTLLNARQRSSVLTSSIAVTNRLPPITDQELIDKIGLLEWAEISEWNGSPVTPYRGAEISVNAKWLEEPVLLYWELDPQQDSISIVWHADWLAIQSRNNRIRKEWAVRTILTISMFVFLAFVYRPKKDTT